LKQKNQKFKATNFLGYKSSHVAKVFELASLRQQILFNASFHDLLNATKFKALASLSCDVSNIVQSWFPLSEGEEIGVRSKEKKAPLP
jgi:hypothetical protein